MSKVRADTYLYPLSTPFHSAHSLQRTLEAQKNDKKKKKRKKIIVYDLKDFILLQERKDKVTIVTSISTKMCYLRSIHIRVDK